MEVVLRWLMLLIRVCGCPNTLRRGVIINVLYRFVKILVIEIFSSVLGLFGLIIGLLVSSKSLDFKGYDD
jgi:hypothetical protein